MSSPEALLGRVLDRRYRVDAIVGRGGMGVVYAGTHLELERPVAIKVLAITDRTLAQRFVREGRAGARARHPNLMLMLDSGRLESGEPYLVMERLLGRDLQADLAARGPLGLAETARVVAAAAEGLDALHAAGVVHRDLKPSNVFLCQDGTVKLVDYGLAVIAGGPRLTAKGCVVGTPEYMAPELTYGELAGPASDVYSLGAIAFEMLSGAPPFDGHPIQVMTDKRARRAPTLWEHGILVPRAVQDLVARALAREIHERPATAGELGRALLAASASAAAAAGPAQARGPGARAPRPAWTSDPEAETAVHAAPETPLASPIDTGRRRARALATVIVTASAIALAAAVLALGARARQGARASVAPVVRAAAVSAPPRDHHGATADASTPGADAARE